MNRTFCKYFEEQYGDIPPPPLPLRSPPLVKGKFDPTSVKTETKRWLPFFS